MSEEKKKRLKEYQKNCRNSLHNDKMRYKIAIAKIIFACSFINF